MKTFKAGEKVRIAKGNNRHFFAEGTIVTLCEDVTEDKALFAAVDDKGLEQFLEIEDIEPITSDALRPGTPVKVVKGNFEIINNDEYEDVETDIKETLDDLKHAPTFKVGDKVRVITDNPIFGWGKIRKGDEGIVEGVNGEIIRIKFPAQSLWYGCEHELELVEDEEKGTSQLEARFKVGDIVKGKSGAKNYRITNESMMRAEVIDVFEDRMIIRVLEHETHPNFVGEEFSVEMEYFELVEEAKIDVELVTRLIKSLTEEQKTMLRELLS